MNVTEMAKVLAEHSYTYPDSFCACNAWVGGAPEREWPAHVAAVLAALDTTPQPALGDGERETVASILERVYAHRRRPEGAVREIEAILAARAHQPTPPAQAEAVAAVERVRALTDEFKAEKDRAAKWAAETSFSFREAMSRKFAWESAETRLRAALDPLTTARAIADTAAAEAGSADTAARVRRTGGD